MSISVEHVFYFNDVLKRTQEVNFSRKSHKLTNPPIPFNNVPVKICSIQKHLGII